MLEVHAPEAKIHGSGDFLLHLFTITVGLLIALSLEGSVEWWHHRNLRLEADANLAQEIQDNQKELAATRAAFSKERDNVMETLQFLEARAAGKPFETHQRALALTLSTLQNASWRTAEATGALGYIEYRHVQRFASAYQLQETYSALQTQTLEEFLRFQSFVIYGTLPETMPAKDAELARTDLLRAFSHRVAMAQIGAALAKTYEAALGPER